MQNECKNCNAIFEIKGKSSISINTITKIILTEITENPRIRMYKLAKECGCKFLFGSDSHSDDVHDNYIHILEKITETVGINEEDIKKEGA